MKQFNSLINYINNLESNLLLSKKAETTIIVLDNIEVIYGNDTVCNVKYCKENKISLKKSIFDNTGCCVLLPKTIILAIKRFPEKESLSDKFSKALTKYLESLGLSSIRLDNNDILIDDYKVASGVETNINGWLYLGYLISLLLDIELIQKICNKPMLKIPKGLEDFGISLDKILEFCKQYWNNN